MTATASHSNTSGPPAKTYGELIRVLPPRPLHDEQDYEAAVEMMGRLIGFDLNADQEDYLEAIGRFVDDYEADHAETQANTSRVRGLDLLRHLLDEHGMTGADLARLLKLSRSMGPKLLSGERSLTVEHMKTLGRRFGIDPAALMR